MAFSELNDSSGSFSYIIPSSDQDMDDVTLGKLLTEGLLKSSKYRKFDIIDGEPMQLVEYFHMIQYFAALSRSQKFTVQIGRNTINFHRKNFMSMFNDISCGTRENEKECESNTQLVSFFGKIRSRTMVIPRYWFWEKVVLNQCRWSTRWKGQNRRYFGESIHPDFRATSPLSRGQLKSKGHGKLSID